MPTPNSTPKGASEKPKDKVDFGNRLAKKRSQEFAAKIAQWNTSGGGIAPVKKADPVVAAVNVDSTSRSTDAEDEAIIQVITPEDNKENDHEQNKTDDNGLVTKSTPQATSKSTTPRKASTGIDVNRKAWVRRKSKTQAEKPAKIEIAPEVKHAGTPKKRVVSDGHWRRDRIAKTEPVEDIEEPIPMSPPKPLVIRKSAANAAPKVLPIISTEVEEVETKPRRRRRRIASRSRSRSRSRERTVSRQETPNYESSGTKLYVKRRQPSKNDSRPVSRDFKSSESSLTASSVDKRASTGQTTPIAQSTPAKMLTPPSAVVARYLNTLMPVKDQLSPEEPAEKPLDVKTRRRRSSRRHSRPLPESDVDANDQSEPEKHEPQASPLGAPLVYGSRIEGWLAHTSDPFRENVDRKDHKEEARRSSHRRVSRSSDEAPTDSRRSKHSRPFERSDDPRSDLSPLTSTLKRRGARRTATSPVKDRMSREVTPVLDDHETTPQRRSSRRKEAPFQRFQNAAHELSTIMSLESLNNRSDYGNDKVFNPDPSVLSRASDGDERKPAVPLKRRLTKHSDLISVLSVERSGSKHLRPRHSTRSRGHHQDLTIGDVMNDITTDELKYQRELRTLVDGVIPVLLNYVLSSNSSSALTAASTDTQVLTKPIVEMGVALERLKSVHRRIPMHSSADLVTWAVTAKPIYAEYLRAWRLGYQDIVVNLAPAEGAEKQNAPRWDDGLPRNKQGELTSVDGERVDVAYLLKRPLVRLKHLCKAFEAIERIDSSARDAAVAYHELVQLARNRSNEEKARLEDEAAAAIDATRSRECRTLAPIAGVKIDATRCVRARDFFDLDLRHSNGQQLNCKVELVMRDDAPGKGEAGDVLFCEVSPAGRWLLFPPVHSTMISARRGRKERQLVVMLRGYQIDGREWREVLALEADEEDTVNEWLSMLPFSPVPKNLAAKSSFDLQRNPVMSGALPDPALHSDNRLSVVKEMDLPIGEQTTDASQTWNASEVNSDVADRPADLHRARYQSQPATILEHEDSFTKETARPHRSDARPKSEQIFRPISASHESIHDDTRHGSRDRRASHDSSADEDARPLPRRPSMHRRTSSVPSMDLPTVRKLRKTTQVISPRKHETRESDSIVPSQDRIEVEDPSSAPAKLHRRRSTPPEAHPTTPTRQKESRPSSFGLTSLPSFTPAFLKKHRRSSSPLKHEYEPSSASSDSDSEISAVEHEESFTSEEQIQDDQVSTLGELKSFPTTGGYRPMRQVSRPESVWAPSDPSLAPSESASQSPYRSVPPAETKAAETVASIFAWSESGIWESLHPEECFIVVTPGLIEAFDNAQAHAAPAANEEEAMQSPSARGVKPLVALELTPLVPLRRGTALDISIRSQPSANSLYRTGNNIMFRSRNTEECEALYHMLNRARIDNPTYIALQRARGPVPQSNWGEMMERQINERPSSSWWNLRSKKSSTYRSNSISRPQSVAATESSIGTMNTAFSALRRFSGSNRFFNIAKSTITSRQGTRSTYSDSLDSGVASPAVVDPTLGTPLGLTNMKIRLYVRETASKWRDMGAARLTILIPPRPDPFAPASPSSTGREKRVIISGKTQGETLLDATLGEACFERIARTGIAISVWKENIDGMVANTGGVLAAKTSVYMVQMKSDREAAYTFGLVGKLRY